MPCMEKVLRMRALKLPPNVGGSRKLERAFVNCLNGQKNLLENPLDYWFRIDPCLCVYYTYLEPNTCWACIDMHL